MFNKMACINTIYDLVRRKGLKIGDVEEKAGVSRGYLSRINKPEAASPSIETLDSIAEQLGVTIDYLVHFASGRLSENERLAAEFVDQIFGDTVLGLMEWVKDPYGVLTQESNSQFKVTHPLCRLNLEYLEDFGQMCYSSVFESRIDDTMSLVDDGYHAKIDEENEVYIVAVESGIPEFKGRQYHELYMVNRRTRTPEIICSSCYVTPETDKHITQLYDTINSVYAHLCSNPSTKDAMRKFIQTPRLERWPEPKPEGGDTHE